MTIASAIISILSFGAIFLQLGSTPIWVPLVIILLVILLFWWGLTRNSINDSNEESADHSPSTEELHAEEIIDHQEPESKADEIAEPYVEPEIIEPDDLKLIEGIGPKIASVLADAGIMTFSQLAEMDEEQLEKIVREDAGIRLANPTSWPTQAHLAAAGQWEELEKLQNELHGGRERS